MLIAEQTEYPKLKCINQPNQNALAAISKACVLRNLKVPEDYVPSSFPKFIETCPTNDKCWIDFKTICPKSWVLKKFSKAFQISFNTNIWKIRHHVCNNLVDIHTK